VSHEPVRLSIVIATMGGAMRTAYIAECLKRGSPLDHADVCLAKGRLWATVKWPDGAALQVPLDVWEQAA
jgi:hypothetical protein